MNTKGVAAGLLKQCEDNAAATHFMFVSSCWSPTVPQARISHSLSFALPLNPTLFLLVCLFVGLNPTLFLLVCWFVGRGMLGRVGFNVS
jgi:hypothetical protein